MNKKRKEVNKMNEKNTFKEYFCESDADIFLQAFDDEIENIAKKHNLFVSRSNLSISTYISNDCDDEIRISHHRLKKYDMDFRHYYNYEEIDDDYVQGNPEDYSSEEHGIQYVSDWDRYELTKFFWNSNNNTWFRFYSDSNDIERFKLDLEEKIKKELIKKK